MFFRKRMYPTAMQATFPAKGYVPSAEFSALPDFAGYGSVASAVRAKILSDLGSLSLAKSRRELVYSVGAAAIYNGVPGPWASRGHATELRHGEATVTLDGAPECTTL